MQKSVQSIPGNGDDAHDDGGGGGGGDAKIANTYLLCASLYSKHFTSIISFNPLNNSFR